MGKFTNLLKMKFSTDIFCSAMVKRSKFQLYRTTMLLAQLRMVASNHLVLSNIKADEKSNTNRSSSGGNIKATRLVKCQLCFLKWLLRLVLRELQVPNALQKTRIIAEQNGVFFF